jgi:geranylgeranyl diphosphate synthase type I
MSLNKFFSRYLPPLEEEMRAVVQAAHPRHAGLFGMLHYHLGWADAAFNPCHARTGKRVRPMLCLLACEACGGDWKQALPAGAAIELMHNFTLIHDDVEDRDEMRRGRPTVWKLWGEAQAVNAGDALFALTHLALLRLTERGVPEKAVVETFRLLNRTCLILTVGQHLDIGFESREDVTGEDYLAMIEGKTAGLAACTCEMGALIAATTDARREHLRLFGLHLGLSFQMRDDILGIWGDPTATGKPAGADITRRKKTLPILHGLEQNADLRALLAQETLSATDVRRATSLLEGTGSREYTEDLARRHHAQALAALEEANLHNPAAQTLHDLAQALLTREQ